MEYFQRVTPESIGIESKGILDFVSALNSSKEIELHSMMIIRHGKCCACGWAYPYSPEYPHALYSFSKTIMAIAIGFAEQEGIINLNEKLVDIFIDKLPEAKSDFLQEVTIFHLLTMSCGHETEITEMENSDWLNNFFNHPFSHKPGTFFKYNTAGTNILSAVLKRKTGLDVTEFLRPRLLEPLGIESMYCSKLSDELKTEFSGGGMKLKTEDIAKITFFMLHRGNWEGKQLLNEEWFNQACKKQIETSSEEYEGEWANGYGYQCWLGRQPMSFRAFGAYGQTGLVYPTHDLIVVMTMATKNTDILFECLDRYIFPAIKKEPIKESVNSDTLQLVMNNLVLKNVKMKRNPIMEKQLNGQVYLAKVEKENMGCSSIEMIIGGAGIFDSDLYQGQISSMAFCFKNELAMWTVWEDGEKREIEASFLEKPKLSVTGGVTYAANAYWEKMNSLVIMIRRVDAITGSKITFCFEDSGLKMNAHDSMLPDGEFGCHSKRIVPFYIE